MKKSFELISDTRQLEPFRHEMRGLLERAGFDDKATGEVLLAVQEALTNVIRHSYSDKKGAIKIDYQEDPEKVKISILDFGKKFDITQVPDPELPREVPGGLGIYLIKNVMDSVSYDSACAEGNLLHLIKYKKRNPSKEKRGI